MADKKTTQTVTNAWLVIAMFGTIIITWYATKWFAVATYDSFYKDLVVETIKAELAK